MPEFLDKLQQNEGIFLVRFQAVINLTIFDLPHLERNLSAGGRASQRLPTHCVGGTRAHSGAQGMQRRSSQEYPHPRRRQRHHPPRAARAQLAPPGGGASRCDAHVGSK